jgi:RNA polymerase sigma-70 factor (ECF subfamily)
MTENTAADDRLARWVREHAVAVRGYLLALVRHPHDADDLLQEVFRKAWQARQRYEERGEERAYLLRIADRLVCDRGRKRQEVQLATEGWRECEPTSAELSPTELFYREEWRQQLATALDTLNDAQKRVLLLRYFGELEFAAIAEQLQLPLGTVLSHCHRGLQSLRKMLAEK